jgi:hypothetical protein
MANSKLEVRLGDISFSGEGEAGWVEQQVRQFFERVPKLLKGRTPIVNAPDPSQSDRGKLKVEEPTGSNVNLASFLRSKNAASNQIRKFLATAEWLQLRGNERTSTGAVTKALRDNHQTKLTNPSDCLYQNVRKGHCEKVGNEFFVTDDGRASL